MIINKYSENIIVSILPGLLSILLSFFSIPIYLKYLGFEQYGNYLILHIALSIALVTNFNLGKIASIKIQKVSNSFKNSIITTTVFISFISSFIVTFILFLTFYFLRSGFQIFDTFNYKLFLITLFISNIYITLENITKGLKKYYLGSFSNLIFYSFSISLPAFFLLINNDLYSNVEILFKLSIYLKIFGLVSLLIFLINKKLFNSEFLSNKIIKDFGKQANWLTLSSVYLQIFDFLDKYLIKIFLGSTSLAIYSIPQQISGKLSVLSDGLISVFIPRISSRKKNYDKKNIFNSNFYGFFYLIGLLLFLINPFLDNIISWWLGENNNSKIIFLFKIFLIVSFYICITHIISTFFDTEFKSKINSQIETFVLIIFILGMIFSIYKSSIDFFAFTILIRSIVSFFIKVIFAKKFIMNLKILVLQNFFIISAFLCSILEEYYLFYSIFTIVLILSFKNFPTKIIKDEFLK